MGTNGHIILSEDYVSFETAKLLKEKGFDEPIQYFYRFDSKELYRGTVFTNTQIGDKFYNAPTLQMACKWLREVHNKHCDIGYDIDLEWYFQIIDLKETVEYDYPEPKFFHAKNEIGFKTYEEACEAALKYTLENLI